MDLKNEREVKSMPVATTVQKWGNSLAIRIPSGLAEQISIQQGSQVEICIKGDEISVIPKKRQKKYSLEELLAQITPENRHEEIFMGIEGNEIL